MKKPLVLVALLVFVLAACNEKAFFKKLEGNWKINKYLFSGTDKTVYFDTTFREYEMDLAGDNTYAISYKQYAFTRDSVILSDTTGYDSTNMVYTIVFDTIHFVDTTVTPYAFMGKWEVLNSDEDLQLTADSDIASGNSNHAIYRIEDISKSSLSLRKGNEEFQFKK